MATDVTANKPFFDALLAENNLLWPAIIRCNEHPCAENKDSTGSLPPDVLASLKPWLAQAPDSMRADSVEQEPVFYWDFNEDTRKLALLDDMQLSRLALVAGVTLHAPALAHVVTREERHSCCEILGEDMFDYAQTRGQYQTGTAGDVMARRDTEIPLPERCRAHGWLALYYCSLRWPKELRRLFLVRLAYLSGGCGAKVSLGDALSDTAWQALWRLVKKCLLREVVPSWKPYFSA